MKSAQFSPLKIDHTELPPNLLLAAKILILALFVKGYQYDLSDHFLPFLPFFDYLGPPHIFEFILQSVFVVFSLLVLFNIRVRLSCFILGILFFIVLLSSRVAYSNAKFFCGCLFFLISLHKRGDEPKLIRWQLAIIYFGAGLNKILDPDWQSGLYFEHWMREIIQNEAYVTFAAALPDMWLSQIMCWLTIMIELFLAVAFIYRPLVLVGLWVGVYFHAGSFLMSGYGFGVFLSAMVASYLASWGWERPTSAQPVNRFAQIKRSLYYSPAVWFIGMLLIAYDHWRWRLTLKPYFLMLVLLVICPLWDLIFSKMRGEDA